MSTPILPWHREAAKEINARMSTHYVDLAQLLARHDPAAAQHAETVRLLDSASRYLVVGESSEAAKLSFEIRRHLATLRGEKGTK